VTPALATSHAYLEDQRGFFTALMHCPWFLKPKSFQPPFLQSAFVWGTVVELGSGCQSGPKGAHTRLPRGARARRRRSAIGWRSWTGS
jgi:hypothetical protein